MASSEISQSEVKSTQEMLRDLPDPEVLYREYMAGTSGFDTFEDYVAEHYGPNPPYEVTAALAKKMGEFFTHKLWIYQVAPPLDAEAYQQLQGMSELQFNGHEYFPDKLGSKEVLFHREALEELYAFLSSGKKLRREELYHSTTCVVVDGVIQEGGLLSASELAARGYVQKSGESTTNIHPITGKPAFGDLPDVYVGNGPSERYMVPRWFNVEERGIGFSFDGDGLEKHIPGYKKPMWAPNTSNGVGVAAFVPINNDTVREIHYDIDAKEMAEKLQRELGLVDVQLLSLQARKLYYDIRSEQHFYDPEEVENFITTLLQAHPKPESTSAVDTFDLDKVFRDMLARKLAPKKRY